MDLSFSPFRPERELVLLPGDLLVLVAGIAAHQAASPTGRAQLILDAPAPPADRFHPIDGSFNAAVAAAFARWKHE